MGRYNPLTSTLPPENFAPDLRTDYYAFLRGENVFGTTPWSSVAMLFKAWGYEIDLDGEFHPVYGRQRITADERSSAAYYFAMAHRNVSNQCHELRALVLNPVSAEVSRDTSEGRIELAPMSFGSIYQNGPLQFMKLTNESLEVLLGLRADAQGKKRISFETVLYLTSRGFTFAKYSDAPYKDQTSTWQTNLVEKVFAEKGVPASVVQDASRVYMAEFTQKFDASWAALNQAVAPLRNSIAGIEKALQDARPYAKLLLTVIEVEAAIAGAVLAVVAAPVIGAAIGSGASALGIGEAVAGAIETAATAATGITLKQEVAAEDISLDPKDIIASVIGDSTEDITAEDLGLPDLDQFELPDLGSSLGFGSSNNEGGDSMFGINLGNVDLGLDFSSIRDSVVDALPDGVTDAYDSISNFVSITPTTPQPVKPAPVIKPVSASIPAAVQAAMPIGAILLVLALLMSGKE